MIPNPGGDPTALACYAPSPTSPYMRACEGIVSGVTVVGQSQNFQLTPEAGYAAKIGAARGEVVLVARGQEKLEETAEVVEEAGGVGQAQPGHLA